MSEYLDPEPSAEPAYITWDGETWYYNKRARYYYNRAGTLLHRALWISINGPIADGLEVHHINRLRHDNRLANLELLTVRDHRVRTQAERTDREEFARKVAPLSRKRLQDFWADRQPRDVTCHTCGSLFQSTGMRAKYCAPRCRTAAGAAKSAKQRAARNEGSGSV